MRWRRGALPTTKWFYRAVAVAGPLSVVALISGWIVTEVGRQPWIVYELMRTKEAVTGAEGIPIGYATLVVVYIGLASRRPLYMLRRLARTPPEVETRRGAARRGARLMLADLALAVLVIGLSAYAVLGGADFGAGFWDLTAGGAERGARVRGLVKHSMGPVWEANHVWLIVVLVVMWTCFPRAFGPIMETLYVPIFLAAVGIIFRGAAFALRGEAATIARGAGARRDVRALVGAGAVLPRAVRSGRWRRARYRSDGDPAIPSEAGPTRRRCSPARWRSSRGAYIAAIFLAADAARADLPGPRRGVPPRALGAAVVAGALALGGLAVVDADAPNLFDGLTSGAGLVVVDRLGPRRSGHARAGLDPAVRAGALHRRSRRRRRCSPGWRWR